MTANVGAIDKVVRVIVGLGLLSLFFVLDGVQRYIAVIGFVPLFTAASGFCPLYTLFGISTCSRKG